MKRIYLTGAALILLLILAVSYYSMKNKPAPASQNKFTANTKFPVTANANTITDVPIDNAPPKPVADERPMQVSTAAYVTHRRHRHVKHASHTRVVWHTPPAPEFTVPSDNNPIVSNVATTDVDVHIEAVNNYYGNRPTDNGSMSVTSRMQHKQKEHHKRPAYRTVVFGPEIGFNQNGFNNNSTSNMQTGNIHLGINSNIRMGDHFAFQPALLYINKGNRTMSTMDVNTKEKVILNYLEMPLDLVVKFGNPDNARITLGAGPYLSYLLAAHHDFSNTPDGTFADVLNPPTPAYRPEYISNTDWGIGGFIGCETPEGIYAKVGAEFGMKDIITNPATGVSSNRNYSYLISIGYMIGGFKR